MHSVSPLNPLTRTHAFVLLIIWTISIGYMAAHLKRGWVPHDEGTLGLSAERTLNGGLPHRDFDDYTGGLTFLHALAFRELGVSSGSMRIVLFTFFIPWVPIVFYAATRFCSAYSAGAVTLLSVAWSVPNYPGPMPSWYNLFFATFGVAALLRYVEVGTRRWLFLAGVCAGLSFLAKITAAYFVAGALLFFIFREQAIASVQNQQSPGRARFYCATVTLGLAIFLALLFSMIHKIPGVSGLIYFVLPAFSLVVLLLMREFTGIAGRNRQRFTTLLGMCVPFGVGIAVPLIVFLIPYLLSGSLEYLVHGLMATPSRAIRFAASASDNPTLLVLAIPMIMPVILASECSGLGRAICGSILALYACGILIFSAKFPLIYGLGWHPLRTATPWMVLAGLAILVGARGLQKLSLLRQQQLMLMLCVTALCSLVQFPFGAPIYFIYCAPLLILFAAALFTSAVHPPRFVLGALIAFYLLFAILRFTPGFLHNIGFRYATDAQTETLTIARARGLRVQRIDVDLYEEMIALVRMHARGNFMYAAPDCPEVYFLSGLQSPARHYFEYAEEPLGYTSRILNALDRLNVNVIAINSAPNFSERLAADLQGTLEKRYPHSAEVGKFQVRWKE
jgi:hypothetical protein